MSLERNAENQIVPYGITKKVFEKSGLIIIKYGQLKQEDPNKPIKGLGRRITLTPF